MALVESGDLRLIRNDSLRFELVAFLSLLQTSEQFLRTQLRKRQVGVLGVGYEAASIPLGNV